MDALNAESLLDFQRRGLSKRALVTPLLPISRARPVTVSRERSFAAYSSGLTPSDPKMRRISQSIRAFLVYGLSIKR